MPNKLERIMAMVFALAGLALGAAILSVTISLLWNHGPSSILEIRSVGTVEVFCTIALMFVLAGTFILAKNVLKHLVEK